MAHIICGHCRDLHESVDQVRDCAAEEFEAEPQEVCCFSCDGLIGWDLEPLEGALRGCGGPDICKRDFPATFGDF